MRVSLLLICFAISIIPAAQQNIDVLHYKFNIELNDTNDTIYGKSEILFVSHKATDKVEFDLSGTDHRGKGMIINTTRISPVHLKKDNKTDFSVLKEKIDTIVTVGGFSHFGGKFIINDFKKFSSGDTLVAIVEYKGIPSDGLIISKTKYGKRSFFSDNWPNRGHNWIPCVDDPLDKASVEFIITAPEHYQVVSNGILVEETNLPESKKLTHWKEDVPIATKVMVIGVADFAVGLAGMVDNCIPVYSWVYPQDRDKGFYDYEQAMEILPFFIKNVGPYGYKKLANVQSKTMFGGLENASTIFYAENTVDGTRKSESLMTHEIAHQWFGNMATEKSFAHLWLSEGFATYFTVLYFEKKYGKDTAVAMLKEDRDQVIAFAKKSGNPVVDEDPDYMDLLNANSYQKGSWVLHMLRRELGDSFFYKSIKTYYATYAGKNADTKDLQQVFEKISGKNLSTFFQQWLYTPGIPKLDINWNYLAKEKKLSLTVKQLQKTPFVFPLELQLRNASGDYAIKTINISKQEETVFIPVKEKPIKLILDPNTSLLFSGTPTEKKW